MIDRLGTNENGISEVSGQLVQLTPWITVCWNSSNSDICDPRVPTDPLRRCPTVGAGGESFCSYGNNHWPSRADVNNAISIDDYDTSPYDQNAERSFRNLMEGFDPTISMDDCIENRLCQCGKMNSMCELDSMDYEPPCTSTQSS